MSRRGRRRALVRQMRVALVLAGVFPVLILGTVWALASSRHGRSVPPKVQGLENAGLSQSLVVAAVGGSRVVRPRWTAPAAANSWGSR